MITPCGGILIDDDLRSVHVQPDIRLPCVFAVVGPYQRPYLLLQTESVRSNPVGQTNHSRLIELVVVGPRSDVHPHRPHLGVLRVSVLVNLRVGVSVRGTASAGPVHTTHVEIDVIGDGDIRIVLLDIVLGPVV